MHARSTRASERDSKQALLEAATAAIEAKADAPPGRRRTGARRNIPWLPLVAGALSLAGILVLVLRPTWFLAPPPAPEPPAIQEASARMAVAREVQRVEAFQRLHGRLPASLAEAGAGHVTVRYAHVSDSAFILSLPAGGTTVTFHSSDNLSAFLGRSYEVIGSRGQP